MYYMYTHTIKFPCTKLKWKYEYASKKHYKYYNCEKRSR